MPWCNSLDWWIHLQLRSMERTYCKLYYRVTTEMVGTRNSIQPPAVLRTFSLVPILFKIAWTSTPFVWLSLPTWMAKTLKSGRDDNNHYSRNTIQSVRNQCPRLRNFWKVWSQTLTCRWKIAVDFLLRSWRRCCQCEWSHGVPIHG